MNQFPVNLVPNRSGSRWRQRRRGVCARPRPLQLEILEDRTLLSFYPPVDYPTGNFPRSIAVGDLNNDGTPDLVTTGELSVLLGNKDGTFQPAVTLPLDFRVSAVVIGDFNNDGIPDLLVSGTGDNSLNLLLGKGDGTFQKPIAIPVNFHASSLAVGDFNGDGNLDFAAVVSTSENQMFVVLGNGDGTFQKPVQYDTGPFPDGVIAVDLNGDHIPDLVVVDEAPLGGDPGVKVFLGKGDGTFETSGFFHAGPFPTSVAAADFNGDGIPDLVTANSGDNSVSILLGRGDGTFLPAQNVSTGIRSLAVAAADFNGDGIADVVVTGFTGTGGEGAAISVLLGQGDGTFHSPLTIPFSDLGPASLVTADFTGDGLDDVAVTNSGSANVSVFLNDGAWTRPGPGTFPSNHPQEVSRDAISPATLSRDPRFDERVFAQNQINTFDFFSDWASYNLDSGNVPQPIFVEPIIDDPFT